MRRLRKAQSILEYTLILGAIIAGVIIAATRLVQPAVDRSFQDATGAMGRMTGRFESEVGGSVNIGPGGGSISIGQ